MTPVLRQFVFVFTIGMVSSLVANGEEQKKEKSKEAKAEALSQKILGHWKAKLSLDEDAMKKLVKDNRISEKQGAMIKKQVEAGTLYFSFQKDKTGKAGGLHQGRVSFDDTIWKIEKEDGNRGLIVITDEDGTKGKLDATFQKDGTVVAKMIPPEKVKVKFPDLTLTLKKIKKLPEENQPMDSKEPETKTSKPE